MSTRMLDTQTHIVQKWCEKTNLPILPYMCFGLACVFFFCGSVLLLLLLVLRFNRWSPFRLKPMRFFYCYLYSYFILYFIDWTVDWTVQLLSHETRFTLLFRYTFFAVGFYAHLSKNALYTNHLLASLLFSKYECKFSKNNFRPSTANFFHQRHGQDNGHTHLMDKI